MISFRKLLKTKQFQFWVFFILFISIRFLPFFLGKTLVFGDNYSLMIPGKIFTAQWLKQGVFPLWNPHIFSGMPWIADINQSVLYPSTLLFVIFSPVVAFNLLLISHAFIAYSGMYLLAQKWAKDHWWALLAGALWMFSTQISGSMNNFSTLQSLVWLPWLAYFGLQLVKNNSAKVWFSIVVVLQFLGGYPQHVLYGIGLAVLLSLFKRSISFTKWLKSWLLTAILTLAISAVAWVPFVDMLLHSTRMEQTLAQSQGGSLKPVMLIKFVLPYFFDNPAAGMKWGPAWSGHPNVGIYATWLGWLAVGASLLTKKLKKLSKEVVLFAVITVVTLLFSLGQYLPGFNLIQLLFPLFKIARMPSMLMIVTNVVVILWSIVALKKWRISQLSYKLLLWLGITILGAGLMGLGVWRYGFDEVWQMADSFFSLSSSPFHTLGRDKVILFQILRNIVLNSFFFITSLYFFYRKKISLVVAILALEILINTQGLFYFAPGEIYDTSTQNSQQITSQVGSDRVLTRNSNVPYTNYDSYWEAMVVRNPFSDSFVDERELLEFDHVKNLRDGMTPNWNMVFGLSTVHGYTTLLPQDYAHLWQTSENPRINFIDRVEPDNELLKQWAVKYYLVDTWFNVEEDLSKYELAADFDRWQLYELDTLARFRFEDDVPVEIENFNENPNTIELVFDNESNRQYLVMADRYDEDWQVEVNGELVLVENYQGMRRIEIQSGVNEITFNYVPRWFYLGLIISSLTMIGTSLIYSIKTNIINF
ncbi:MAG: YfhO family protein [Candidatus Pacebacteria bacterium]|jgi:hypothetical protein|nr:YfhO family protein [Candidatus Paceibacterota bacterium]MBT3511479.1 YfhO family protein [Candidatus Paceibacterota bacterium]MBT4004668.1 YfhO family protein [Candidatus Paceibacterota bacterium]MBT4358414.1 YfhO family protein [Candidatus Paceibacterota bacterium]MBT4680849.1 YfhO family protein [Candidatus Paceibacterota bacterium]